MGPRLTAGAPDKKIDNFLPSRPGLDIVFQKADKPGCLFPMGSPRPGLGVKGQGMTREWRHKPLKSLKTDSAIRGFVCRVKEALAHYPPAATQDETGRLAAARRRVAFASHRRVDESTRGDKVLRKRA
jgi:hypothetical protein